MTTDHEQGGLPGWRHCPVCQLYLPKHHQVTHWCDGEVRSPTPPVGLVDVPSTVIYQIENFHSGSGNWRDVTKDEYACSSRAKRVLYSGRADLKHQVVGFALKDPDGHYTDIRLNGQDWSSDYYFDTTPREVVLYEGPSVVKVQTIPQPDGDKES